MEGRIGKDGAIAKLTCSLGAACVLGIVVFTPSPLAAAPSFSAWAAPENLGPIVNSASVEIGPSISKDGRSLYFASNRSGNFDIWVSQRVSEDSPWEAPVNLGAPVNTTRLESVPTLSRDGHWLFFNSDRPGGFGGVDIWASFRFDKHDDFAWQEPVNLGPGVNFESSEANCVFDGGAFLFDNDDDDGTRLLFFGSDRPGVHPAPAVCPANAALPIDIYVSEQMGNGSFGPAMLVPELNSVRNDQRPVLRSDGRELFLFSDRGGNDDLWTSTRESEDDAWSNPVNLGPTINTAFRDVQAFLASDRRTLFFASNKPSSCRRPFPTACTYQP